MASITVYTRYRSGNDFGGTLKVSKLSIQKRPEGMYVEFEGEGSVKRAWMYLDTDIAIPLARNILSVAEGYVSKLESEVA